MSVLVAYAVGKLVMHGLNKANTIGSTITSERMEQANIAFRDQIGLGKDFKFDKQPFDDFMAARKKSIDELATTFATAIKDEKLKAALDKADVKKLVQDALLEQGRPLGPVLAGQTMKADNLDVAQKAYNDSTRFFAQLSKQIPPLKVEAVIQTMKDTVDRGVQDIQRQQQLEKANFKKLFDPVPNPIAGQPDVDSPLVAKLKADGVDVEAAKKAMMADLKKSHFIAWIIRNGNNTVFW